MKKQKTLAKLSYRFDRRVGLGPGAQRWRCSVTEKKTTNHCGTHTCTTGRASVKKTTLTKEHFSDPTEQRTPSLSHPHILCDPHKARIWQRSRARACVLCTVLPTRWPPVLRGLIFSERACALCKRATSLRHTTSTPPPLPPLPPVVVVVVVVGALWTRVFRVRMIPTKFSAKSFCVSVWCVFWAAAVVWRFAQTATIFGEFLMGV